MKKILILLSTISITTNLSAGTHGTTCSSLFPSAHCTTWDESDNYVSSKTCTCSTCQSSYPDTYVHNTSSNGYQLIRGCTCASCSCLNNPTTSKTGGSCTCGTSGADYSTCTTSSTSGTLCIGSTSSCAHLGTAGSVTINGQVWCAGYTLTSCTISGASKAYYYSKYCNAKYGANANTCLVYTCSNSGATPNGTRTTCVCKPGYYGSSDGTNCTACPIGSYKNIAGASASCTGCPKYDGVNATTASTASDSITDCYIPASSSFSDSTGTWQCSGNFYYSE